MSILNVNTIQPVGSGQTITVSATNISAPSTVVTASSFVGNVTGSVSGGSFSGISTAGITTAYIGSINDGPISGARNRIINGDMRLDQRNAGTSVTVADATATFGVDRFRFTESTSASSCTVQQVSDAPTGFTNSLKITVGTGGSASAGQVAQLCHPIEGYNWADLLYGSSSAKFFTIQFWVKSSLTGTYCFSIFNSAGNRSYVAEYTIIAANTWEYKTITVAGDTTGTWLTTNGAGAFINWDFGGGSNFNVTANTWGTTSYASRTTNQVNWISNSGATFYLTGVQLESGTVATPFERRSYGQELALAQRYYCKSFNIETAPANGITTGDGEHQIQLVASGDPHIVVYWPVIMRSSPIVTLYNPRSGGASGQWGTNASDGANARSFFATPVKAVIDNSDVSLSATYWRIAWSASAEL